MPAASRRCCPTSTSSNAGKDEKIAASGAFAFVIGAAALCVAAAPFAYSRLELAPLWYPVVGVDVSNHQGVIDWPKVRASGVAFAYIKATEGGDVPATRASSATGQDAASARHPARRLPLLHRSAEPGAEQARNFIAAVPEGSRGPAAGRRRRAHGALHAIAPSPRDHRRRDRAASSAMLEAHYGDRPLVYTTAEFDAAMLEGKLASESASGHEASSSRRASGATEWRHLAVSQPWPAARRRRRPSTSTSSAARGRVPRLFRFRRDRNLPASARSPHPEKPLHSSIEISAILTICARPAATR